MWRPAPSRHFRTRGLREARMTLEERASLVLAFARVLYINGLSTDQALSAAERLGDTVGLRAKIMARWGELQLQAEDRDVRLIGAIAADPSGVNMDRVASAARAMEELRAGRLAPTAASEVISAISRAPPAPTWLFTLAAAAGAVALAVLFGVQHLPPAGPRFGGAPPRALLRPNLANLPPKRFPPPTLARLV